MECKSVEEIRAVVEKVAAPMGIEIVDVTFSKGANPSLTVYADTEGGIDLDTCEKLHRAIDAPLDELDPTYGAPYTLNVSSPGLDRPFKTERDFARAIGKRVEIKLYAPMQGKKYFEGVLLFADENAAVVQVEEKGKKEERKFARNRIAKINRAIEWE